MKMFLITIVFSLFVAGIACTKGGVPETVTGDTYSITAAADSKQLVPAIDSNFVGSIAGYYDQPTNILTCTITWSNLWLDTKKDTVTSVNVYGPATPTTNGPLVRSLPFVNTNKAGSINLGLSGSTALTTGEAAGFLAGSYYYTINTKRYPAGIIRGKLAPVKN